jgi:hypothetical protein
MRAKGDYACYEQLGLHKDEHGIVETQRDDRVKAVGYPPQLRPRQRRLPLVYL